MRIKLSPLRTCVAVACLAGGFSAHAQTIQNSSFESPQVGTYLDGAPTSFREYVPNGGSGSVGVQTFSTGGLTMGTAAGNQSLYINPGGATGRGVYQDLGTLQANTTYLLTFAATAGTYQSDIAGGSITVNASFYNGTAPSGNALATTAVTLITANHTFTDYTLTYTTGATVSNDLTLLLSESSTIGQSNFDNLRLSVTTVPEASTWVMMGTFLGLLGLSRYRRRVRT